MTAHPRISESVERLGDAANARGLLSEPLSTEPCAVSFAPMEVAPMEVATMLAELGGRELCGIRFLPPSSVEEEASQWTELCRAFDTGQSEVFSHALFGHDWIPIASSHVELWAYAPTP